ncbi:hypothetical protein L1987_16512 [Smallanthus sonchifolius]|uniref:Uncharacterized protein n=1 Tax=Smallanthus sonchifolius TaxID=185202 RepID=A0ACB9JC14_9ASTR|nr:hypothetical protein L1987_16512 [Smallanthus sonchifolius]
MEAWSRVSRFIFSRRQQFRVVVYSTQTTNPHLHTNQISGNHGWHHGVRHRSSRLRIILAPQTLHKNSPRLIPFSIHNLLHSRHGLLDPMERIHHSRRLLLLPLSRRLRRPHLRRRLHDYNPHMPPLHRILLAQIEFLRQDQRRSCSVYRIVACCPCYGCNLYQGSGRGLRRVLCVCGGGWVVWHRRCVGSGGVIGAAGEMPERYMQAVLAGTAASGVLISILRIFTKAVYSQDEVGLRKSANLYFIVSIIVMIICIVLHNIAHRLPVIKHYNSLKIQAVNDEKEEKGRVLLWQSTLWDIVGTVKWYGLAIVILYVVTLAIFPGYITEDVHSQLLKDWYPIILITCYNVFDLIGKTVTSFYVVENSKVAIGASFARLVFFQFAWRVYMVLCFLGPRFL